MGTEDDIRGVAPSARGSADWFTGEVWVEPVVQAVESSRVGVAAVRFAPGARTAWHVHDGGQTLYVTEGEGRVQSRGEAMQVVRAGDVVQTPSGAWHWHGAAPEHAMAHLSFTDGKATWGDHVTDDEYGGAAGA